MYRQSEKKLLNSNVFSICPHNVANFGPLTAEICSAVWGHPSKFQRVSRLGFVTAATSLTGGQQTFVRSSAVSWPGTLYIYIFEGSCLLTEFCQISLRVQVLRSPILAALLHGTRAAAVYQTLWRGTRKGITEISQRALPIFGWAAITLGIGHILLNH